jgi:hypothetical protein
LPELCLVIKILDSNSRLPAFAKIGEFCSLKSAQAIFFSKCRTLWLSICWWSKQESHGPTLRRLKSVPRFSGKCNQTHDQTKRPLHATISFDSPEFLSLLWPNYLKSACSQENYSIFQTKISESFSRILDFSRKESSIWMNYDRSMGFLWLAKTFIQSW